jgi:hypothetical protein
MIRLNYNKAEGTIMKKGIFCIFVIYVGLALLFISLQGCDVKERQYIQATEDIIEHETLKYIEHQLMD